MHICGTVEEARVPEDKSAAHFKDRTTRSTKCVEVKQLRCFIVLSLTNNQEAVKVYSWSFHTSTIILHPHSAQMTLNGKKQRNKKQQLVMLMNEYDLSLINWIYSDWPG